MPPFKLVAPFQPTGDQPQAIERLADGLARGMKHQTLLGATGTGKSLAPDEPVLIGRQDAYGGVRWSLEPIGELVDRELGPGPAPADRVGTSACAPQGDGGGLVVATIDPETHRSVVHDVYAVSRHAAPETLYRVTTDAGHAVTVTPDHNFVRLGPDSALEVIETGALREGDYLPLPSRLPSPAEPTRRIDVASCIARSRAYVTGPAVLASPVAPAVRRAIQRGSSSPRGCSRQRWSRGDGALRTDDDHGTPRHANPSGQHRHHRRVDGVPRLVRRRGPCRHHVLDDHARPGVDRPGHRPHGCMWNLVVSP